MSLLISKKFKNLKTEPDKLDPNTFHFTFSYLLPNMAKTLGNFLRRVISEYASGIAIIGVKISDRAGTIESEGKILEAVDRMPYSLISELGKIVFKEIKEIKNEEIFELKLSVENKKKDSSRIVKAEDFLPNSNIEIKNSELELAILSPMLEDDVKNPKLEIIIYCKKDQGYYWRDQNQKYFEDKKIFPLDSIHYSHIKGFKFKSKESIIDKEKYEELIISITTDEVISPKKVFYEAIEESEKIFNYIKNKI